MRTCSSLVLVAIALGVLFLVSCSGNVPVQPPISPDREVAKDLTPVDPIPEPFPWWDCQRFFAVTYEATYPGNVALTEKGGIRIRDEDCSADQSMVKVRFKFNESSYWTTVIPGTKTVTNIGKLYEGNKKYTYGSFTYGYSDERSFEVLTHPQPSDNSHKPVMTVIEGWLHRHIRHWWTTPDGEMHEANYNWHWDIVGKEVFIAIEPEPKP